MIGQTTTTVELQGGIKLPKTERSLVGGRNQTFVLAEQRLVHTYAVIGFLDIVAAIAVRLLPSCILWWCRNYRRSVLYATVSRLSCRNMSNEEMLPRFP